MADAQATFSLNLEGNAAEVSDETAASFEEMRSRIAGSEESIKALSGTYRRLKGNTDDVKAAKAQLNAKINAERAAVIEAHLQLLKQGVAYDALAAKAKKLAVAKEELKNKKEAEALAATAGRAAAMGNAVRLAGGPVSSLRGGLEALSKVMGGASGAMGAMTLAAVGAVAVIAALAVGVGVAAVALAKFVIDGANAARSANLLREAATGSAEQAGNLGTQVDAMSRKVSTSKGALNELAASLAKSRLSGQAVVDTFAAVAQASDAMGDATGNKLRDIIERGQISQRVAINPLELMGSGLNLDDIAKPLAASMRVGVKEAKAALVEGRVSLDAGAKAIRDAVEKRFGQVNAKKMLDINVQAAKFKEKLDALTSGVNLEPLLQGLDKISGLFDESTVTGASLKELVTVVGTGLVGAFNLLAPIGAQVFKGLVIAGLRLAIGILRVKKSLTETFGGSSVLGDIDAMNIALTTGKAVVYGLAAAVAVAAVGIAAVAAPVVAAVAAVGLLGSTIGDLFDVLTGYDWAGLGTWLVDGFVDGIKGAAGAVVGAVAGIAASAKDTLKAALGIASPSKVFASYGAHTVQGFSQGVEQETPKAQSAVDSMAPSAPATAGTSRGGSGGGGDITINVNIVLEGGGGGGNVAAQLTGPSFKAEVTRIFEEIALSVGLLPRGAS